MYNGQSILIPMGGGGLQTDLPQSRIAPTQLIEARNISLINGYCEKHPGSVVWNKTNPFTGSTTFSSGIQTFQEYFPSTLNQRVLVLCKDGTLHKFISPFERVQVTADLSVTSGPIPPTTFNVNQTAHIAVGGNETAGGPRKAFIFSGGSPVQVLEADGITYRPLKKPANDWASSYPVFGLIYRSRLWCFGNTNAQDFLYASKEGDQEDFQTTSSPVSATDFKYFDVAGGEGSGITGLFVFKNRLYICKGIAGLYQLNDSDANPDNWSITRVNADFGLSNSHGIAQVFDDVLIFNTQGSVTSVSAAFQFGDIESSDVLNSSKVERYFRQIISGFGINETYGLYYPDKKQVYFTFKTPSSLNQNGIMVLDIFNKSAQISYTDKDQPNCLGLIQDVAGIGRPVYGSQDGNLYSMDSEDRVINNGSLSLAYNYVAQTPHMDFGFADTTVGLKTKRFDFLEVTFQPTGDWDLLVDVYIDSELKETIPFNLKRNRTLGPGYTSPLETFINTTATGTEAVIASGSAAIQEIVVTNSSLVSIGGLSGGTAGETVLVSNYTGNTVPVVINASSVPFSDRIIYAISPGPSLPDGWTIQLIYNGSQWVATPPFRKEGFILDEDTLEGDFPKSIRKPLHGQGRTISFKLRSNGLSQNIKVQSLMVYFRTADERQIKDPRT